MPLFIGTSELLLIAALVLLLFGGKKLPEMMRGLGQGVKAFKEGMNENENKSPDEERRKESTDDGDKHETDSGDKHETVSPHDNGKE